MGTYYVKQTEGDWQPIEADDVEALPRATLTSMLTVPGRLDVLDRSDRPHADF